MQNFGIVSIITPTWNCAEYICETIQSVQTQTYQNWELIISDDCSTDNTKDLINPYLKSDNRIKYICNHTNSGAAITRNNALKMAKGKWIAFLDSDDLWLPTKLERQISFMHNNGYAFTYHAYTEITEEGKELGVHVSGINKVNVFDMYSCCWPGCLTVMYDREKIGLIQINDVRKNNDTAMWFKIIKISPCYFLNEPLARYRRRSGSITPPNIFQRIWAHYPLFRVAEEMNPINATFWTLMNVFGNAFKKLFFVKKYDVIR